jgi:hypothetical protein
MPTLTLLQRQSVFFIPLPATFTLGSTVPITTFGILLLLIATGRVFQNDYKVPTDINGSFLNNDLSFTELMAFTSA